MRVAEYLSILTFGGGGLGAGTGDTDDTDRTDRMRRGSGWVDRGHAYLTDLGWSTG